MAQRRAPLRWFIWRSPDIISKASTRQLSDTTVGQLSVRKFMHVCERAGNVVRRHASPIFRDWYCTQLQGLMHILFFPSTSAPQANSSKILHDRGHSLSAKTASQSSCGRASVSTIKQEIFMACYVFIIRSHFSYSIQDLP